MRFTISTLALLAAAGAASAATVSSIAVPSPTASGTCDAQNIVDACVAGIKPQIDACGGNDWMCLCAQYTNLATCYNNCPNSAERIPVDNQVTAFCQAAAPLISSSLAAASTLPHWSSTATSAATTGGATAAATTASGTQASAKATSSGVAGVIAAPIGGVLAVVLGLAGLL